MQIGFEIWTMQSDILFDNVYIGHSLEDANKLKNESFDIKHKIEQAEEDAAKPKPEETPKMPGETTFKEDPINYVREKVDLFYSIAKNDPIQAVKMLPEVAGGIGALAVTVLALLIGLATMGSGKAAPQVKDTAKKIKDSAVDAKDQAVDAAATGSEKIQSEINKRTTRSSGPAE